MHMFLIFNCKSNVYSRLPNACLSVCLKHHRPTMFMNANLFHIYIFVTLGLIYWTFSILHLSNKNTKKLPNMKNVNKIELQVPE